MHLVHKIDELGRPAWIVLTIAAFCWFWPVGLGLLGYLGFSGRLAGFRAESRGRWHNMNGETRGRGCGWRSPMAAPSSGNKAFDEYRSETLRRLEEEQKEFRDYLDRLRQAKDKQEFDQFMADRRRPPVPTEPSAA